MVSIQEAKNFIQYGCNVPSDKLDTAGDLKSYSNDWRIGKYNGPPGYLKAFNPPKNYTAIGLKVLNCFDGGDNTWLGTTNREGEWYVGYHGVKSTYAIRQIIFEGFKKGPGQQEQYSINSNTLNNFSYKQCGEGAYFAQNINTAEEYASPIDYNGKKYKVVFMCRVNPKRVKICEKGYGNDYMITNGSYDTKDEVRPYRILIKKI